MTKAEKIKKKKRDTVVTIIQLIQNWISDGCPMDGNPKEDEDEDEFQASQPEIERTLNQLHARMKKLAQPSDKK